jgi:hypothetical protein
MYSHCVIISNIYHQNLYSMKNEHAKNKSNPQSVSNCCKLSIKINTCNTAPLFGIGNAKTAQLLLFCEIILRHAVFVLIALFHYEFFSFCYYWRRAFSNLVTYTAKLIDVIQMPRPSFFVERFSSE